MDLEKILAVTTIATLCWCGIASALSGNDTAYKIMMPVALIGLLAAAIEAIVLILNVT